MSSFMEINNYYGESSKYRKLQTKDERRSLDKGVFIFRPLWLNVMILYTSAVLYSYILGEKLVRNR